MSEPYNALFDKIPDNVSQNVRAEKIMGKRRTDVMPFDQPCELDYHCPVCKYELIVDGNYDERLQWSEYNSFLWCAVCNKDYPSCLCTTNIESGINVFLLSVEDAIKTSTSKNEEAL
jgi:hypothetical protein